MKIMDARARSAQLKHLNIFITMTDEDGPGEVVAVKDLIDVRGTPTSGGSTVLPMDSKAEDAPLVAALRESGCVIIGKTNMHEWAFGSTSINPHYGTVPNPRDVTRISGGSSGGSAAAVAAGLCDWSIGTDTGGSVRIPAALCGVVGFKPTLGTIDTAGVLPLSFSLDTIGSLASDVTTATHGVELMARQVGWTPTKAPAIGDLRLAVPADWVADLDEIVGVAWAKATTDLPEIPFPPLSDLSKGCLDLMYSEAGAYHRRWIAESPERYGVDVLERLRSTYTVSGADYVDAMVRRDAFRDSVAEAMDGYDAVLVPTTAAVAPLIQPLVNAEPLTRFTRAFNYTGQPVFSLPLASPGLPVGIQIIGRMGRDVELASIALALEQAWSDDQTTV
jgi:aspartyl-tRNA(Asn)/glutamyl-tRNA(Gln) amidotransferase subunit A